MFAEIGGARARWKRPRAHNDNLVVFLRGCKELGLKESQLFDPGDLQDTSNRAAVKVTECSRKLKNVLVTIYWLGKAANSCTSYSGATLDLKEFEGLLAQMRKESDDVESPKRSIRDSGYIDCWDSERSDSLSPPRHGRDDSFDSLDSFGSRSQQTPSPDVILRGSSDGRGSDSESDFPHRKIPDVKKDDMSARRVSYGDNKAFVPFNQYLPNKSNQSAYIPAPLRKKKAEREEYRKSWSTATSPLGGERTFSQSHPELINEENSHREVDQPVEEDSQEGHGGKSCPLEDLNRSRDNTRDQAPIGGKKQKSSAHQQESTEAEALQKLKRLEHIGIKVMPAAKRYSSQHQTTEDHKATTATPDILLRKENIFMVASQGKDSDSEEEHEECRVPDIMKDDLATRRIRMNQTKTSPSVNHLPFGLHAIQKRSKQETIQLAPLGLTEETEAVASAKPGRLEERRQIVTRKENLFLALIDGSEEDDLLETIPDIQRDDLAKRKTLCSASQPQDPKSFVNASITKADLETWERLKLSAEMSDDESKLSLLVCKPEVKASKEGSVAVQNELVCRKVRESRKRPHPRQRFVHFGPVTEIDQQKWEEVSIVKPESVEEVAIESSSSRASAATLPLIAEDASSIDDAEGKEEVLQCDSSLVTWQTTKDSSMGVTSSSVTQKQTVSILHGQQDVSKESVRLPDPSRDDMIMRRLGTFRKIPNTLGTPVFSASVAHHQLQQKKFPQICLATPLKDESSVQLPSTAACNRITPTPSSVISAVLKEDTAPVLNVSGLKSTEAEDEMRVPDPEKDDMMTRRTGVLTKLSGLGLKHFLPVPFTKQKEDLSTVPTKADKQVRSKSPSNVLRECRRVLSPAKAENLEKSTMQQDGEDVQKHKGQEEQPVPPAIVCPQPQPTINPILPGPTCKDTPQTAQSDVSRFSSRAALSDDTESMSMFDMRCDDETQPHSRIHQEHLQNVNSLLKEEDDQWQNDLARWKTRRRSASQDLIQKEQERKKMEKVLSGEDALSERRKSIKTYKEIVEEKERREKELHEAYKNAKSEEEAERILQKYIERFTISEAVLERLQMPKILERSQSVQPNLFSLPEDPSPMKYLRQLSVPVSVPKFTSTVEATISPSCEAEVRLLPERTSPNKPVSKAVPLLVPKPYSQPKSTQGLRTFKVEGNVSMNGESFNGIEDENGSKGSTMVFEASPDRSEAFEGVSRVDGFPEELKQESTRFELDLQQSVYRSMCNTLMALPREETKYADQHAENNLSGRTEGTHSAPVTTVLLQSQQTSALFSVTVPSNLECASPNHQEEAIVALNYKGSMDKGDLEGILPKQKQKVVKSEEKELEEYAVSEFSNKTPEVTRPPCQNTIQQVNSNSCEKSPVLTPSLNSSKHVNFWSWDPEEERKRQERWQQEQERLLQERYQREQEKLKDEWEKAQKEVQEEERKYYEEERKIIEDTIVPFAVSSSSAETFSSCSSSVTEDNRSSESLVRSVPELKPNHVVAENQKCAAWKNCDETEQKAVRTHSENHNPLWGEEGELQLSSGRGEPQQEETSRKEVSTICHDTTTLIRSEQASQVLTEARNSPTRMQLKLQGAPRMTPPSLEEALTLEELRLEAPSLNQSSTLPAQTSGGIRGSGSHENVKPGLSSPCSPTPQCHSPNRSISGKKLCSTCGLPLGKGAAMIIETLSLFFHIQCFQCGICKGQLGDTTSGTDVRIRNGLLNCNDCYMRSRTAGQPTTL